MVMEPWSPLWLHISMAVVLTTVVDIFILTSLTSLDQGQPRFPAAVVCWELGGRVSGSWEAGRQGVWELEGRVLGAVRLGVCSPPLLPRSKGLLCLCPSTELAPVCRDLRSPADWGVGAQEPAPSCLVIWSSPEAEVLALPLLHNGS